MAWNPDQYLRFGSHRTRPAAELLARVDLEAPKRIYDLGCGPGNSTGLLRTRWPKAQITGVDSSPEMLDKAAASGVQAVWQQADLTNWQPEEQADLVYSNATLHWLENHERLFARLKGYVRPGGWLAVQMPRSFTQASHTIIQQVVENGPWADRLANARNVNTVCRPEDYYGYLNGGQENIDIWETEYLQVLTGPDAVFEWLRGTSLVPYSERLNSSELAKFESQCRSRLANVYRQRDNGVTLYPFRRLFIVAKMAS